MVDKVELNKKIRERADFLLVDIHLMTPAELMDKINYFSEDSKGIAERILEKYIFSVFDNYTEGDFAINDLAVLAKFVDLHTGYQQQMLDWIQKHPLEVKKEYFEIPPMPDDTITVNDKSPRIILGVGTVVAVGLYIFTNIWIALAAEILSFVMMKNKIKQISKQHNKELEIKHNQYKIAIEMKKNQLINGMIKELENWLELGVKASNEILLKFNL